MARGEDKIKAILPDGTEEIGKQKIDYAKEAQEKTEKYNNTASKIKTQVPQNKDISKETKKTSRKSNLEDAIKDTKRKSSRIQIHINLSEEHKNILMSYSKEHKISMNKLIELLIETQLKQ